MGIHPKTFPEMALTAATEEARWNFHRLWKAGPFVYCNLSPIASKVNRCLSDALAAILAAFASSREYAAQKASKGLFCSVFNPPKSMRRRSDIVAMSYFLAMSRAAMRSSKESGSGDMGVGG